MPTNQLTACHCRIVISTFTGGPRLR